MRTEALIATLAMSLVVFGQSPKPIRNPIPPGRGVIAGRVIDAVSRQPVRGATVNLQPQGTYGEWAPGIDSDPSRQGTTGVNGEFRFTDLGAIDYDLSVWLEGYSQGGAGQTWSRGSRAPIRLGQDQQMTAIEIRLWPTADLSGRVLDERGLPLAGAVVTASGEFFLEGRRQFSLYASQATTDDRGEYRMTFQPPTRVVLCVGTSYSSFPVPALSPVQRRIAEPATDLLRVPLMLVTPDAKHFVEFNLVPPPSAPDGSLRAYVSTCAPSNTSRGDAAVVEIRHGGAVAPDLIMQAQPASRISGRLVGPDGPIGQVWLRLLSADDDQRFGAAAVQALTAADGTFTFLIVPPGSYTWDIQVSNPNTTVTPSASGFPVVNRPHTGSIDPHGYWVSEPIHVDGGYVDGLQLSAQRGVTVSGRIVVDGPASRIPGVSVSIRRSGDGFRGHGASTNADGRFMLTGVKPDRYGVSVGVSGLTVTAVTSGTTNLLDSPLGVEDKDVADLVIRLSSSPAGLTGIVRGTSATTIVNATVVVFPTDERAWKTVVAESLRIRSTRAVAGRYTFEHLPPGDYYVAAIDDALMARWMDPALFTTLASTAARVSVQLGEQRTLDLIQR